MQLGQLLLIQIGLFIHSGLVAKLKSGQKQRKANETWILREVLQIYLICYTRRSSTLLETEKSERSGVVLEQFKEL